MTTVLDEFLTDLAPAHTGEAAPLRHATILSAAVATVHTGLEPRLRELQDEEARRFIQQPRWVAGGGLDTMCAVGLFESILRTLTDIPALMAGARTSSVWLLLGHAADRLDVLNFLAEGDPAADPVAIVSGAQTAQIALQTILLDVLGIPDSAAPTDRPSTTPWVGVCRTDSEVTRLVDRVADAAAAASVMLPRQVTNPIVDADQVDYTQVGACITAQTRLGLDLLDLATRALCEHLDNVCLNPWWEEIAADVSTALAATQDRF